MMYWFKFRISIYLIISGIFESIIYHIRKYKLKCYHNNNYKRKERTKRK